MPISTKIYFKGKTYNDDTYKSSFGNHKVNYHDAFMGSHGTHGCQSGDETKKVTIRWLLRILLLYDHVCAKEGPHLNFNQALQKLSLWVCTNKGQKYDFHSIFLSTNAIVTYTI